MIKRRRLLVFGLLAGLLALGAGFWLRAHGCEVLDASEQMAQEVDSVLLQTLQRVY